MREQTLHLGRGGRQLVQNETILGNSIGFRPQYMAYAANRRKALQKEKPLGKRTVFSSRSPLCFIQQSLGRALSFAFDDRGGTGAAIAYRRRQNVQKLLAEKCAGCKVFVKTDIVKYYDHISRSDIKESLAGLGYVEDGPKVVSWYMLADKANGHRSLQQGSAASPAMANIVGADCLDAPIEAWLKENCKVPHRYYRYSDNLALFLNEDPGQEWVESYKSFVRETAEKAKFRTHSWATLRPTNVALAQQFLGVVLNMAANVSRDKRDFLRAAMFNAAVGDFGENAEKWCEMFGIAKENAIGTNFRFVLSLLGCAGYVGNVNGRQGLRLKKLAKLAEWRYNDGRRIRKCENVALVKRYKCDSEPLEVYLKKAKAAYTPA